MRFVVSLPSVPRGPICINQADTREKNRQVLRMYTIYENAQSVLIWLGLPDKETDIAMEFIQHVNSGRATEYLIKTPNGGYRLDFFPHLSCTFAVLYKLLTRSYFTRFWVVQEIAMSSTLLRGVERSVRRGSACKKLRICNRRIGRTIHNSHFSTIPHRLFPVMLLHISTTSIVYTIIVTSKKVVKAPASCISRYPHRSLTALIREINSTASGICQRY